MSDIQNWINQIDRNTTEFQKAFGELSPDELNRKPNPNTWSIAQNIDHLIVINSSYFSIFKEMRDGNYELPFVAKIGFIVNLFGRLILNAVKPETKRKIKTLSKWEPSESEISPDILERFKKHQEELKQEIIDSKDLLSRNAIISSPANKYIVYHLKTAFDIIIAHEQRHLNQALEVKSQFPETKNASA